MITPTIGTILRPSQSHSRIYGKDVYQNSESEIRRDGQEKNNRAKAAATFLRRNTENNAYSTATLRSLQEFKQNGYDSDRYSKF